MTTTFKNAVKNDVTTIQTVYTCPAATTAVVIGFIVANDAGSDTTIIVEVTDNSGAVTVRLCNALPLPAASNVQVCNENNRLVLEANDSIKLTAGAACDAMVSVMELS